MTAPPASGAEALRQTIAILRAAGVPDAPRDARLLVARALGLAPDRLTLHLPDTWPVTATAALAPLVDARAARQPMAQILGERLFWGRAFVVTPDTLDPRPETEILVETALSRPFLNLLDLGTGTGCILISCLLDQPLARGLGTDLSPAALEVARGNAARHGLEPRAGFARGDWWQAVPDGPAGRFDLIVSNPPYIAAAEMATLAPDVRDWEPRGALTPEGDGLDAYRAIAAGVRRHLSPGGRLLLEIGPTQATAIAGLLAGQGLTAIRVVADLDGRDRVVVAEMPHQNPDDTAT